MSPCASATVYLHYFFSSFFNWQQPQDYLDNNVKKEWLQRTDFTLDLPSLLIYVQCLFMFIWYWGKYKSCVYPNNLSNSSMWMASPSEKEGLTNCRVIYFNLWYPIPWNFNTSRFTAAHNDPWFFNVENVVIIFFVLYFHYRQLWQPYLSANIICPSTLNVRDQDHLHYSVFTHCTYPGI